MLAVMREEERGVKIESFEEIRSLGAALVSIGSLAQGMLDLGIWPQLSAATTYRLHSQLQP